MFIAAADAAAAAAAAAVLFSFRFFRKRKLKYVICVLCSSRYVAPYDTAVICICLSRILNKIHIYACASLQFIFGSRVFLQSFGLAQLNYVYVAHTLCAPLHASRHTNLDHNKWIYVCLPFIQRFFFSSFSLNCKINKHTHTPTRGEKKIEFNNSYYNRSQFTLLFVLEQHLNDICSTSVEEKWEKLKNSKFYFHLMLWKARVRARSRSFYS